MTPEICHGYYVKKAAYDQLSTELAEALAALSELRKFKVAAEELAVARQKGYADRRHGGVVNGECADGLVQLCREHAKGS